MNLGRFVLDNILKKLSVNLIILLAVLFLISSGLVAVTSAIPPGTARSIALLWCFACLSVGLLSGFLFAIPRVPPERKTEGGQEHPERKNGTGLGINTNLEEISDWLTKILVGIGLVEASKIRSYLGRLGAYVGSALGANGNVIASGLIVLYLGLGFLSGFLVTRLFISPSLRQADEATSGVANAEKMAIEAKDKSDATLQLYDVLDAAYSTYVDFKRKPRPGAHAASNGVLPPELAISYIDEFQKFYEQPRWSLNRRLHLLMANFYYDLGRIKDAMGVLTSFINAKEKADEIDIHLAAALYNRACYHATLFSRSTNPDTRTLERKEGLADLSRDVSICPSDAAEAKQDNDLEVWWTDPEFMLITGSTGVTGS